MPLTLQQANRIIETALARCAESGFKPMAVVVVDDSGHIKSAQRQDGASMLRIDIAAGKAFAAVGMGVASRVLTQRAKDLPAFFNAIAATAQGRFIPQTGAVLVKDADGTLLGAVGASGGTGDEDELVCAAGVEAAGLTVG
ncbi:MAG: heme-binding protein [Burkholderiaceae bacterium]|nr:heme-binding protein [Burkholderiaceae bacterium]